MKQKIKLSTLLSTLIILFLTITVISCQKNITDAKVAATFSFDKADAYDVEVAGNIAYVANSGYGIVAVDIQNPKEPKEVGRIETGSALAISIANNYAFVGDWSNGLVVVDIKDPANMSIVAELDPPGSAYYSQVEGNLLYLGNGIFDITDPANLSLKYRLGASSSAMDIFISGKYAYLASSTKGIEIIDISNLESPEVLSVMPTAEEYSYAKDIVVKGEYAFIVDHNENNLQVISIKDPKNPEVVKKVEVSASADGIDIKDNYVFVGATRAGVYIFDIKDPLNPTLVKQIKTDAANTYKLFVKDNYVYAADMEAGLTIIELIY